MNWRMWILFLFTVCLVAPLSCLETYNSQITKELGFDTIKANAMASVGVWCRLPLIILPGRLVAITGRQGLMAFLFMVPYPILTGAFRAIQEAGTASIWTKYGVYQAMVAVGVSPYTLGVIRTSSNARTPTQRSVNSALYVMLINTANSFATQIFRADDRPKYLRGLVGVVSLQSAGCVLLLVAMFVFWYVNKHSLGDAGLLAVCAGIEMQDGEEREEVMVSKKF